MSDLRASMKIAPERMAPAATPNPAPPERKPPAPPSQAAAKVDGRKQPLPDADTDAREEAPPTPPAVDPLQWWTALTQQFTEIATNAMRDSAPLAKMAEAASKATAVAGEPSSSASTGRAESPRVPRSSRARAAPSPRARGARSSK
ncbi:MAG TPA: hypothetical protein VH328_10765, partial [Burkholderiaceae bacterium]|nr:hypothetical protein [Burkholderiaceae bacterium]